MSDLIWQTKLACRLHDPAEKALVLMRDPAGHEGGTVRELMEQVFGASQPPTDIKSIMKRADQWAAAGDRPQFPLGKQDGRYPKWCQVHFDTDGEIIHPTSGQRFEVHRQGKLNIDLSELKSRSLAHYRGLLEPFEKDPRLAALALWRFGPELKDVEDNERLGSLWQLLPADTRVPEHTIWDHLDLTCAFGTAMAADSAETPAVLTVSLGPVQEFIAQARSTSDLWAGSHLLSSLSWEAMRVVCEQLGPEQLIQPQLRGAAVVDAWLVEQGLPAEWFEALDWRQKSTDANPLFAAALPNRFVALVPATRAESLAESIKERVQHWLHKQAQAALAELLEAAGEENREELYCHEQLRRQLDGFPEVHWSSASFALIEGRRKIEDSGPLQQALAQFHDSTPPGLFGHQAWESVENASRNEIDGIRMFKPNPGTLYPALTDLGDRTLGAAKSVRPFTQSIEHGFRDSLGGEREWLTHDKDLLAIPPGKRRETIWTRAGNKAWARKGEHLDTFGLLKRLWPTLFARQVARWTGMESINRFVVSTHSMALARNLESLADADTPLATGKLTQASSCQPVALPRRLAERLHGHPQEALIKRIPDFLDDLAEAEGNPETGPDTRAGAEHGLAEIAGEIERLSESRLENYYALILMDGDNMGAWLNGSHERMPTYSEGWHSHIEKECSNRFEIMKDYFQASRLPSPAWHKSVSTALNHFALKLVPAVVERAHKGKVIYAGGDDVLAMVSIDDLLSTLTWLRLVYSGIWPRELLPDAGEVHAFGDWANHLKRVDADFHRWSGSSEKHWLKNGFIHYGGELLPTLGFRFTASAGAVIAHKKDPLQRVVKQLRGAENRAKQAGRNAFCIQTLKRSGGAESMIGHWFHEPLTGSNPAFGDTSMARMLSLASVIGNQQLSRRAIYHAARWLRQLPDEAAMGDENTFRRLLATNLAHQFRRQTQGNSHVADRLADLARGIVDTAMAERRMLFDTDKAESLGKSDVKAVIQGMLATAEFLARDGRHARSERKLDGSPGEAA